jgi:hypothetical protein
MFTPALEHPYIKDCRITKRFGMASMTYGLWGKVKIVTDPKEHSDFDVKLCPNLASLYVKKVKSDAHQCGEWQFVDDVKEADFSVRFVSEGETFTICFVKDMPGTIY